MFKKLNNKKGFTLMEMLIVVAIIAILVAIAIPSFTSSLEKTRQTADLANVRATYAEVMVSVLEDGKAHQQTTENMTQADGNFGKVKVPDYLTEGGWDQTCTQDAPLFVYIDTAGVCHIGTSSQS